MLLLARAEVCCSAPQTYLQPVLTPAPLSGTSKHSLAKERGEILHSRPRNAARKKKEVDDTLCLSALGTEGALLQRVGACHRQSE